MIIKSRMEVIPTTKELADVFVASYELVNAKAGSIRRPGVPVRKKVKPRASLQQDERLCGIVGN